jgi:cytoskeletal protein CcmA (bactofilin family)
MVGNIESVNIYIGGKGVVRGNLRFENNLTVLEGADISGHVQKNKKEKIKRLDSDKVKYLEQNKIAS